MAFSSKTPLAVLVVLALFSIQTYVMIDGFVLYYKWRQLIIPSEEAIKVAEMDDSAKSSA